MKRHAIREGQGYCPLCAAHGIDTLTADPRQPLHYDYAEIDDGGTEPLSGILCAECAAATHDRA